jgi:hypothetical protein
MLETQKLLDAFNDAYTKWCVASPSHSDTVDESCKICFTTVKTHLSIKIKFAFFVTDEQMKETCSVVFQECDKRKEKILLQKNLQRIIFSYERSSMCFFSPQAEGVLVKPFDCNDWLQHENYLVYGRVTVIVDFFKEEIFIEGFTRMFEISTKESLAALQKMIEERMIQDPDPRFHGIKHFYMTTSTTAIVTSPETTTIANSVDVEFVRNDAWNIVCFYN